MFPLICAWMNGWVNNREAGDLRRHHAHDVSVMKGREKELTYKCRSSANSHKWMHILIDGSFISFVECFLTHWARKNGHRFLDDFSNSFSYRSDEYCCILIGISLKSVPSGSIDKLSRIISESWFGTDSDNGLSSQWWCIILCIYASLDLDDLEKPLKLDLSLFVEKWSSFCRRHFKMHFLEWNWLCFDPNLTEISIQLTIRQHYFVSWLGAE